MPPPFANNSELSHSCPDKANSDWIKFFEDLLEASSPRTVLTTLASLRSASLSNGNQFVENLSGDLLRMLTTSLNLTNQKITQLTSLEDLSSPDYLNLRDLGNTKLIKQNESTSSSVC